jgi:acetate---CoA ligase (ADP-forming)
MSSLVPFFSPQGVALIGASRDPGKLSYGVMQNLTDPQHGFPGPVYPVNPKADEILGRRCYPSIADVPDPVDLAVLVIPGSAVVATIEACGRRGVKAAIVISGGFREVGQAGLLREQQTVETARRYDMRVMGPNGIGVIDTRTPLNTTFVRGMPAQGNIAFLSQSGALCGGVIDWVLARGVGFSRLMSVGNEADVNETDLLPFLATDEHSRVLALYLEDVKGGKAFATELRKAAHARPTLVMKTGRTASGQQATASHTGALATAHTAFAAVCRQAGAIEVGTIQELFDAALLLSYQPLPAGGRVAVLTNAGGPAALAADCFDACLLTLARTSSEVQAELRPQLAPDAQTSGPVDMLGGAMPEHYGLALEALLRDKGNDAVLVVQVPQVLVDPAEVVRAVGAAVDRLACGKPVALCLMGGVSLPEAEREAHALKLPAYTFPEDAVAALGIAARRAALVRSWQEVGEEPGYSAPAGARERVASALADALAIGASALSAEQCRLVLESYEIPVPAEVLTETAEATVAAADRMGYPVALKIASPDILHKSDVGGVRLNLRDAGAVKEAFDAMMQQVHLARPSARLNGVLVQQMIPDGQQVIVGVKRDDTFGPQLMFGLGGIYAEALKDVAFAPAPLTSSEAADLVSRVRSSILLDGLRGAAASDRVALIAVLERVGRLAADHPQIAEMDINPLVVRTVGAVAVDVRVILG